MATRKAVSEWRTHESVPLETYAVRRKIYAGRSPNEEYQRDPQVAGLRRKIEENAGVEKRRGHEWEAKWSAELLADFNGEWWMS